MRLGTWNVRRFHRSELPKTVVRELANYRLGLERVHEVKWEKDGTEPREDYTFPYENGMKVIN
jgi:hypothetical protein